MIGSILPSYAVKRMVCVHSDGEIWRSLHVYASMRKLIAAGYADDAIVFVKNSHQLLEVLDMPTAFSQQYGLWLNPSKCNYSSLQRIRRCLQLTDGRWFATEEMSLLPISALKYWRMVNARKTSTTSFEKFRAVLALLYSRFRNRIIFKAV